MGIIADAVWRVGRCQEILTNLREYEAARSRQDNPECAERMRRVVAASRALLRHHDDRDPWADD